jgi:predicted nucleic acid-binding protein
LKEILLSDQREQIKSFIRAKSLTIFELSADEIVIVSNLKTNRSFKGITDKSVLWKASELVCPLLTGDKKLRKEAEEMGIEVHGSIWVIEILLENNLIRKSIGIEFLENLKLINGSLPYDKIDNLIRQYKK